jgi:3-oxoacyl-[acyl-carrier protein] reductase
VTDAKPTAIVTGGATGIGAATALLLARRGWNVLINTSRNKADAERMVEACKRAGGGAEAVLGNVAVDADCRKVVDAAAKRWGRVDALVNCAAITKFCATDNLSGLSAEDFQDIMAVNVVGVFQMARAAADLLRASGGGAIVNVSSNAAVNGLGSSIAYSASKGALNTLTLALARALAPHVRVNAVLPGFTVTPWQSKSMSAERLEQVTTHYKTTSPLRRATSADDIADAIFGFIEGSKAVTGQFLMVDAGNFLHMNLPPPPRQ